MIRVGILGGGFNPPHKAHLFAVTDALSSGLFDEIWVIPCWEHAFNKNAELLPFEHRLEMCKLAFSQWPNVIVQDHEQKYQTKHTISLLRRLVRRYKEMKFSLIMGTDNLDFEGTPIWKNGVEIKKSFPLHIVSREKSTTGFGWTLPNISSTSIRTLLRAHKTNLPYVENMLPKRVYDYIIKNNLYGGPYETD